MTPTEAHKKQAQELADTLNLYGDEQDVVERALADTYESGVRDAASQTIFATTADMSEGTLATISTAQYIRGRIEALLEPKR